MKEGRRARQSSAAAQANVAKAANVAGANAASATVANDNADSICWFCHADVSSLERSKCAGCRKVTQTHLSILIADGTDALSYLLFQAHYCDQRCQKADWGRHGDYCAKVQEKIRKKIEAKKAEKE